MALSPMWAPAAAVIAALLAPVVPASADPGPGEPDIAPVAAAAAAPVADSRVASSPPSTSTLEGVTLTISAKDESQRAVAPLTTAVSTREYVVGGVFTGSITGSVAPEGIFEVGYQIGCGIDMSTGGGVLLGGNAQVALGSDALLGGVGGFILPPIGIVGSGVGANAIVGVNLKPGIINTVPVTKKTYKGAAPEAVVSDFRVKIDGCVGESFIRSYATLANSTVEAEDIVSWFGVTTVV
ncbi:Porin family, mycobacterial-type [Mycobacteriaceae bacterium]